MEKKDDEINNNNIESSLSLSLSRVSVLISQLCLSPPRGGGLLRRQPLMASDSPTVSGVIVSLSTGSISHFEQGAILARGFTEWRFDKIINKEIPSKVVFEDDLVLAFRDIDPQAPTHILIIPKVKDGLIGLSQAEERHCEILGRLMYTAKLIAKQEGLDDGYRVVINDGPDAGQSVYHLHVHIVGGRQMNWPPG